MRSPPNLKLQILPPPQRALWGELSEIPEQFTLYGGTALALQLGHRQSIDFDFFAQIRFRPDQLISATPLLSEATIIQQEPNTLKVLIHREKPISLSFFGLPAIKQLRPSHVSPDNHLKIASLLDIAGTKASVIQQRAEMKDYLDIDAIMTHGKIDLPTMLAAAKTIFGRRYNPLPTLKALSYFEDGDLGRLPTAVKKRLATAAKNVDIEKLPLIAPYQRRSPDKGVER